MNTKLLAVIGATVLVLSVLCARGSDTNSDVTKYDILIEKGIIRAPGLEGPGFELSRIKATLDNVIDYIFRVRYTNANFILSPELHDVQVSDMKLGNVRGNAAQIMVELDAIGVASGNKFTVRCSDPGPHVADSGTFLLEADPAAFPPKKSEKSVEAFNLSGLFKNSAAVREKVEAIESELNLLSQNYGPNHPLVKNKHAELEYLQKSEGRLREEQDVECEYIEKAVGDTLEQLGIAHKPTFNFHSAMQLLVVIGTQDEIDMTRKIVNALLDKSAAPASSAPVPPAAPQP